MSGDRPDSTPEAALREAVLQALAGLAQAAQWLPGTTTEDHDRAAETLAGLAEEIAEAATMARALPDRPPGWPGHTFAAAVALVSGMQREPDFPGWLADILDSISPSASGALAAALAPPGQPAPGAPPG